VAAATLTQLSVGDSPMDDRRLLRLAGLALPAAVWVLGLFSPPPGGSTPGYLAAFSGLLAALAVVDATAPRRDGSAWRRLLWLAAELVICFAVVRLHGTLIRPALVYLLPVSRALVLFGERDGLLLSLSVWLAYGLNVGLYAWPDRLGEFPNYLSFLLPLYVAAVVLTVATLRQAADRSKLQGLYDELQRAHEQLQAMHGQARELAVTQERNRLAREIHDSLAHYLTVINVQLEAAEKLGADQRDRAQQAVGRARRLTLQCLQDVRHSVAALRASAFEATSLPRALRALADEFSEGTEVRIDLDLALPDDAKLAPETALALYRAAQEGLTNVQRHAGAGRVLVSLTRRNGTLELVIRDDGQGPSPGEAAREPGQTGGFGLLGLRERVELLGGRVSFGRGPAGGGLLVVTLPADEAA
jgi:signal transduction histidine kinase